MRRFLAAAVALAVTVPAAAGAQVANHFTPAEAQAVFQIANEACLREDWATCVEGYERLLEAGFASADLYFNLGTASLKQQRIGWAVLHLERALRLDPGDEQARQNLEYARRLRIDKLVGAPEEVGGGAPLPSRIASHTRGDHWAVAFLALWIGGWLLLFVRRWASGGARIGALLAGVLALTAAAPCAVVTGAHVWIDWRAHEAVVVAPSLPVRDGPADGLKASFEIHEGLKVRVLDRDGAYKQIRLSNGLQGWVPADGVVEIAG